MDMNQTLSLQQLADRLVRVEREMNIIRGELTDLRQQTRAVPQTAVTQFAIAYSWADKEVLRRWIKSLFAALSIQGVPMGAQLFQQRMGQAGLTLNELSRNLVEARAATTRITDRAEHR
jgi:hypothetical protein